MFKIASTIAVVMITTVIYSQKTNHQLNTGIKMNNASILQEANEFVKKGQYENFLAYCTEDTKWIFVGGRTLMGKGELREYIKEVYWEPPVFTVETTIEEGNFVTVTGEITLRAKSGESHHYDYCDVWRFENGKLAALKAYVIEKKL